MPRRRLCLGFYVCDLEFGICPTLVYLFLGQPELDMLIARLFGDRSHGRGR